MNAGQYKAEMAMSSLVSSRGGYCYEKCKFHSQLHTPFYHSGPFSSPA